MNKRYLSITDLLFAHRLHALFVYILPVCSDIGHDCENVSLNHALSVTLHNLNTSSLKKVFLEFCNDLINSCRNCNFKHGGLKFHYSHKYWRIKYVASIISV